MKNSCSVVLMAINYKRENVFVVLLTTRNGKYKRTQFPEKWRNVSSYISVCNLNNQLSRRAAEARSAGQRTRRMTNGDGKLGLVIRNDISLYSRQGEDVSLILQRVILWVHD